MNAFILMFFFNSIELSMKINKCTDTDTATKKYERKIRYKFIKVYGKCSNSPSCKHACYAHSIIVTNKQTGDRMFAQILR